MIITVRLLANRLLIDDHFLKRVVIYGAGSAGIQLAGALRVSSEIKPVAFLDSNKALHNTYIAGIKVLHPKKLRKLLARGKVDEVLLANLQLQNQFCEIIRRNGRLFSKSK